MSFMSPELLVPSNFGMERPTLRSESDIYAFGLVIFQVCEQGHGYCHFYIFFLQVLTGETPFRSVQQTELGWSVVRGLRPPKPENASAIGFSDPLWSFTERCWDGNMTSRPKAGEVVTHLEKTAADWNRLMPPCAVAEDIASTSERTLGSTEYCE